MRILLIVMLIFANCYFAVNAARENMQKNALSQFYYNSFGKAERDIAKEAIKEIIPNYNSIELDLVLEEVLAVHHLVYHETKWHNIQDNVSLVRRYEHEIQKLCNRYKVPIPIALSILTWENSGGIGKRSYTNNIGFGQLGSGAVSLSHVYGAKIALSLLEKAREHYRKAKETGSGEEQNQALALQRDAREYDLSIKHRHFAQQFNVADERDVPLANIEDSIVFLKILLNAYADRTDLAIAAYHNGMQNMDDLLWVYLKRKEVWQNISVQYKERIPELIRREHITYLALWNDQHLREIMSGLRAVSGKIASKDNNFDTLGDESDLYLWKIIGAYGAYKADAHLLAGLENRYLNRKDQSDTNGLISFITEEDVNNGVKDGELISNNNITARLALFGLLKKLGIQNKKWVQILGILSPAKNISFDSAEDKKAEDAVHAQGLSVDIDITNCKDKERIRGILKWWYHFDRIYFTRLPVQEKMIYHISINPRFSYLFEH